MLGDAESMNASEGDEYPGRTLHQAAIFNNTELLMSLLQGEEKCNVGSRDNFGRTVLYTSVTNNSLDCAEILLQAGGRNG